MVDHLLQTGANVHARDDGGLIPLHNACSFGHSEVGLEPEYLTVVTIISLFLSLLSVLICISVYILF